MSRIIQLDWSAVEQASRLLAQKIQQSGRQFAGMIAVTRGGLVPAGLLARHLDIRWIETVCVQSYEGGGAGAEMQGGLQWIKQFTSDRSDILVVDDLVDSGETFEALRPYLPHASYAVLYAKPAGKAQVDFYAIDAAQDEWLSFPWEIE